MNQKIAVVTGGGKGIGLSTCELLAEHNYTIVVADIDETSGKDAANRLRTQGAEALFISVNVSQFEEVKHLIDETVLRYGKIDLLVNNAGVGPQKPQRAAEHSLDDWDKIVGINQSGVFYGMKVALGHMMKQGHGNIVNVASLAGINGSTTGMAYSASKFAVVGMTKSAALEYASKNIRVNCVCPSFTDTALLNDSPLGAKEVIDKLVKSIPMKRLGTPKEIAEAIYWLGSDQSSFVTGHALILDGGSGL